MNQQFQNDVDTGLSSSPRTLPSKYFYNEIGDALFVKIMHSPEYYLARSELEIFQTKTQHIIDSLCVNKETYFELIELGAGDGFKTKELLKALYSQAYAFDFFPVDISQNALNKLERNLSAELPNITVKKRQGDYFDVLKSFKETPHPKVVLFLGSNIGNLNDELAAEFIYNLGSNLKPKDKLLLGVDLKKPASIVLPAYNDKEGLTREFNLNLLRRINDELGADFNLNNFSHLPEYEENEGIAKSFLVSTKKQTVRIKALKKDFCFEKNEKIHTEISRKYDDKILDKIIAKTDFSILCKHTDHKHYFANYTLNRK